MKEFFPTPCSSWAEKLAATHPDDLTSTERQQLQAHMASCSTCSAIRTEYEIMGHAISQLPTIKPVPRLSPALSNLLNAQTYPTNGTLAGIGTVSPAPSSPSTASHSTRNTRRRQISPAISTLAAVLVVAALLGSFLILFASRHPGTGHSSDTRAWHIIPSANPGSADNALLSIAALSANDAWAVGFTSNTSASQASRTLIEHWNGAQWSVVASPNSAMPINMLNDVVALSTDDIWAVGFTTTISEPPMQPLIEHWNGARWSIVSIPALAQHPEGQRNTLSRLIVLSANNVWGVGTSLDRSGHSTALIVHWNGTTWTIVHSPSPGSLSNELHGAVAISANDIWAVGYFANGNPNTPTTVEHTLIEHWDGIRWSIVPSPEVGSIDNVLNAATAVSANDIWAIGIASSSSSTPMGMGQSLIEHWNGVRWSVVKGPNAGPVENFDSLTALAANDIWAVGVSSNGSGVSEVEGLTLHWDGSQWRIIPSPNPENSTLLSGIGKIPGSRSIWAAGYYNNPSNNKTYALTLLYH